MNSPRYLLFASAFLLLTGWMLRAFMPGIVWGGVFAISLWPLYRRTVERHWRHLPTPTLLFSLIFAIVFVAPLVYIGHEIIGLYSAGSTLLIKGSDGGLAPPAFLSLLPEGDRLISLWQEKIGQSANLLDAANRLSESRLTSWLSAAALSLSSDLLTALCMLVSFYFMLKHGAYIAEHYATILGHWFSDQSVHVVNKGISALRGTINGVILVGLLEGVLLAIPLVWAGVQSGLLLGLAAGIMGVIPMVMPVLILPCAAYLYFSGQTLFAILTAVDLLVVWLVFENIVKPGIISSAVKVNPWLVLLGLIGGLQMFGPVGLFLGPALVAMSTGMARDLFAPP